MVVSKGNVTGYEADVSWASQEMRDQLDHLESKDPSRHHVDGVLAAAKGGVIVQPVE